jgi:hypothetical protein
LCRHEYCPQRPPVRKRFSSRMADAASPSPRAPPGDRLTPLRRRLHGPESDVTH